MYNSGFYAALLVFALAARPAQAETDRQEAIKDDHGRVLFELSPNARNTSFLPLTDIFARYNVDKPQFMRMSMNWDYLPNPCGEDRIYFLNLEFRGNCKGEDCTVSLALQTLTFAHLERLYKAIKKNFHKKGLPACLDKDRYWDSVWDRAWMRQTFQPELAFICSPGQGQAIWMPVTRCINEDPLY